ncbi:MAG: AAA domain-containing protein [Spirochaetes bacterium]|jgi:MoxR-like ATPase|nr:AAA domain-containing protein [Spirochaetota bacterium]
MSELQSTQANAEIREASNMLARVRDEVSRAVVGQAEMIDGLLMGVLANGHVLLEGVPGLAKTLAVKTISAVIDSSFKRIQFTPDLLPADLVGNMVYRQQTGEFVPRKGPVFSNIVLADEINRAPAKVQSALLESMEERQVTIGDQTYGLPEPFFVLATQNPIEQEGTYPLPEAQLDRFIMKLTVNYPSAEEELSILRRIGVQQEVELKPVLFRPDIRRLKDIVSRISVDERIEEYIVALVTASRETSRGGHSFSRYIEFGASPRATIYLYRCAKVKALFEGRDYVVPEDVKSISRPVLRHRIVLSYEAEAEELTTDDVVNYLLSAVPVP